MTNDILNHLWQSTAVAALCALLTLAMRRNRAHVRYALWIAASAKFLIPFQALIAAGRALGQHLLPPIAGNQVEVVLDLVRQPLTRSAAPASARVAGPLAAANFDVPTIVAALLAVVWLAGTVALLARWAVKWWRVARIPASAVPAEAGREVTLLRRVEAARGTRHPLALAIVDASVEPAVFGVLKPCLLWPRGISEHLDDSQVEAILIHELSHVRRHDNAIAAIQMGVQALFWFHPLVWWIGARLIDERERACDEDVLHHGSEPEIYAESILRTCRFSIESPLACMSGVTGADLKQRIEAIMSGRTSRALGVGKRTLLAIAASAAIAVPLGFGAVNAPRLHAQDDGLHIGERKFEVASVKPNNSGSGPNRIALQPGGRINVENMTLRSLIRFAFQVQEFQLVGGPDWLDKDRFDIVGKAEQDIAPAPPGTMVPGQLMLRTLLAERFRLALHREKRELPIYALVLARRDGQLGPQLRPSTIDCEAATAAARRGGGPGPGPTADGGRPQCGMRVTLGLMQGGGFPLTQLVTTLSQFVQRVVVNKTGLTGTYDIELKWTPDRMPQRAPGTPGDQPIRVNGVDIDPDGPSIFTALQEQLGLKLESTRDSVDVLVIDHAEPPTPD